MYRLIFIVALFIIFIPIVWRIINKIFIKVEGALKSPENDAGHAIENLNRNLDDFEKRKKIAEEEAEKAAKASEMLSNWNKDKK